MVVSRMSIPTVEWLVIVMPVMHRLNRSVTAEWISLVCVQTMSTRLMPLHRRSGSLSFRVILFDTPAQEVILLFETAIIPFEGVVSYPFQAA